MPRYAKLRSDLTSERATIQGVTVYNIKDPVAGSYFRLREPEFWLINQLDGNTSYETIAERFRATFSLNITADNIAEFVAALEERFFLENARSEQLLSRSSYGAVRKQSLMSRMLFIKIRAFHPGKLLDRLTKWYRPFHRRSALAAAAVVIVLGAALLISNWKYFSVNLGDVFNVASLAVVVMSIFIIVSFHEFAHAVVCRYHGGEVREMGFLLLYFQPCFYTDLSDAWLFGNKSHRLAVTWAGPFCQLVLLSAAVIVWRVTVVGSALNEIARIVAIVGWVTLLFNFNPLIKLDGYYLLSDWLDIPNLRRKAFAYFGNILQRRVLGWPVESLAAAPRERRTFVIYAVFALLYSVFLIGYMVYLLGGFLLARAGPIGLLALVALLAVALRSPAAAVVRGTSRHLRHMKKLLYKPFRLAVYLVLVAALIVVLFLVPFGFQVSGGVAIRPLTTYHVLLNRFGLLETRLERGGADPVGESSFLQMTSQEMAKLQLAPLVQDGDKVVPGDMLAILSSNQVTRGIAAGNSELNRLNQQLALLRSPPKGEEIDEAEAEVAATRAAYEQAERDLRRGEQLSEKQLISAEEVESARAAVDIARAAYRNRESRLQLLKAPPKPEEEAVLMAQVERQKAELAFLESQIEAQSITTPVAGTVTMPAGGDEFMCVLDHAHVEVLVPVSDFDINLVRCQQPVTLKVRPYPGTVFAGRVARVPQSATHTDEGGYFPVSVIFDNDRGMLLPGMTGYAKIHVGHASLAHLIFRKVVSTVRVEFWSWW